MQLKPDMRYHIVQSSDPTQSSLEIAFDSRSYMETVFAEAVGGSDTTSKLVSVPEDADRYRLNIFTWLAPSGGWVFFSLVSVPMICKRLLLALACCGSYAGPIPCCFASGTMCSSCSLMTTLW
jgi:hypothetical protein